MAELPSLMTRLPGVERLLSSLSPRLAQQSKFVVEQSKAVIGRLSPRLVKQSELVVEQSQALASRLRRPTSDSGLAEQLEWTLKEDVHNTSALSVAVASSMADRERYGTLVGKLHHVYTALEKMLDESKSPAVRLWWDAHAEQLRRADKLAADLQGVSAWPPAQVTRIFTQP